MTIAIRERGLRTLPSVGCYIQGDHRVRRIIRQYPASAASPRSESHSPSFEV
jgi:hypothetical protein